MTTQRRPDNGWGSASASDTETMDLLVTLDQNYMAAQFVIVTQYFAAHIDELTPQMYSALKCLLAAREERRIREETGSN